MEIRATQHLRSETIECPYDLYIGYKGYYRSLGLKEMLIQGNGWECGCFENPRSTLRLTAALTPDVFISFICFVVESTNYWPLSMELGAELGFSVRFVCYSKEIDAG